MSDLPVVGGDDLFFDHTLCERCPIKQMSQRNHTLDVSVLGPVRPNSIFVQINETHIETHIEVAGVKNVEQTNQNYGNAGVVGTANNQGQIIGQQIASLPENTSLLEQLTHLRNNLKPEEGEHYIALGKVAEAEQEVKNGSEPTPLKSLSEKGGKWVLSFAESVGAKFVVEYLKHHFGW